jgi:hypothetical protein
MTDIPARLIQGLIVAARNGQKATVDIVCARQRHAWRRCRKHRVMATALDGVPHTGSVYLLFDSASGKIRTAMLDIKILYNTAYQRRGRGERSCRGFAGFTVIDRPPRSL